MTFRRNQSDVKTTKKTARGHHFHICFINMGDKLSINFNEFVILYPCITQRGEPWIYRQLCERPFRTFGGQGPLGIHI